MRESAKNVNGSSICNFLDTEILGMVQIALATNFVVAGKVYGEAR